jgi:leader peptidase (prepilin peptidase) / N-methyltransferase
MIEIVLAFLAGLLIGSFLNVCVFRLPRDLSVVTPARSFCPFCEKTIAWYDNIPVLSYILLRAKCRQCGARIPLRYPAVELSTAVAFAICVKAFGLTLPALKYAIFSAIIITLIASDFEERILPDEFTIGGSIIGLVLAWFVPMRQEFILLIMPYTWGQHLLSLGESLLGACISSGSIWLAGWLYEKFRHREGLGFGDVKMIFMIGAFLGLPAALLTLVAASLIGAVGGLIYVRIAHEDMSTYELPFGSFLGAAALAVAIYTETFVRLHQR